MELGEKEVSQLGGRRLTYIEGEETNRYAPSARAQAVVPLMRAVLPLARQF